MKYNGENVFTFIFCILRVSATFCLCIYWCYEFSLDEDLSVVRYKKFHETTDDVYPTVSLCFRNPFMQKRLEEYGTNQSSYSAYLAGEIFSTELSSINYSYVTTNIMDYIKGYKVYFENATLVKETTGLTMEMKRNLVDDGFNGFLSWSNIFHKCFAFQIPKHQDVNSYRILFSNKLFHNSQRRSDEFFCRNSLSQTTIFVWIPSMGMERPI